MNCYIGEHREDACACQGEADVVLLVKHHHTDDGGCQETTLAMCVHHYGHYLMAIARQIASGALADGAACSRCEKVVHAGADIFERVV